MPGFPVITNYQSLLKLMSVKLVMPSNHLILYWPFSSHLQSFPGSRSFPMSQFYASGSQKYWSFSISPSTEYSGLISFRMDWLDLPAVQGTHKSLLQHHSSKASKQMGPKTNLNKFKRMAITEYAILPHGIRLEIVTKTQNRKISTTGNHTSK